MFERSTTRRGLFKTGAAATVALSLPAIVRAQSTKSLRPVSLQADWIYGGPNAGFLVAKEHGFYAAEGLDVTINQGKGSGSTAQIVAAKAAQFGFADGYVIANAASKGAALKMVAGIFRRNPAAVIALADSDIKRPKDLEGKMIGITTGSAQFQEFPAFMKGSKIDAAKVRIVNVDAAGAGPALINGRVAAIGGFAQGYVPAIEFRGKKKTRVFWYSDAGVVCMSNGLIVHPDTLSERDVIRAMVRASVKGFLYGRAHPDEMAAIVKKYLEATEIPITLREAQLSWSTWVTPTCANKPLGWMPPEDWVATVSAAKTYGGVTGPLDAAQLYTNEFVPEGKEFIPPQSV